MNIDAISKTLPNGFHDSELVRIEVDYAMRQAVLTFDIDLSDIETDQGGMQRGRLTLAGLVHLYVEPPENDDPIVLEEIDVQTVVGDSSDFEELKHRPQLPKQVVDGFFRHWFYSCSDNNFIYVCYKSASFEWTKLDT